MKIAICQLNIKWEDKAYNQRKAYAYMKEAALNGADLILFPEMSLTGFTMNIEAAGEASTESVHNGLHYSGDSCMIDPLGNRMEMLSDKEGLLICDIPDNTGKIRSEFPVGKDRRTGERKPCITII